MPTPSALALGAGISAALLRERRRRKAAERLAAAALETILNAVDANDSVTGAHVRRVARYALILGEALGLGETDCRALERVALFHDIGKIHEALFDLIHEDTKLTAKEKRAIATHPARGADVLAPLAAFFPELADCVLAHHECWDGSGYPRKLAGEEIPFIARIVSVADTFDAVTSSRRYSHQRSAAEGARVISSGRGTQFDPALADLFLLPPVFEKIVEAMRECHSPRRRPAERRTGDDTTPTDIAFRWRR